MIITAPPPQTAPRKNLAEKFAVRIAEGGNDGGGPGGAEAPSGPSVKSLPPRMSNRTVNFVQPSNLLFEAIYTESPLHKKT